MHSVKEHPVEGRGGEHLAVDGQITEHRKTIGLDLYDNSPSNIPLERLLHAAMQLYYGL